MFRVQGFRASDLPGPTPSSLAILHWPNMISKCNGLEKVGDLRPGSVWGSGEGLIVGAKDTHCYS